MATTNKIAALARIVVLISLTTLLITLTLENWLTEQPSVSRWLVQIFPLFGFLPTLIRNNLRSYQWLCFVILLYFSIGVLKIFTPEKLITGIMLTLCSMFTFSAAIFYIHQQQKALSGKTKIH
ncbi:MAG: DUF2069 domain-containing protein [Pseudohongiellaceae bacterium]